MWGEGAGIGRGQTPAAAVMYATAARALGACGRAGHTMSRSVISQDDHVFGRAAVALGVISYLQLRECLHALKAEGGGRTLGAIMLERGLVDEASLAEISRVQRRRKGARTKHHAKEEEECALGKALLSAHRLTLAELEDAVLEKQRLARKHMDMHLGEVLITRGLADAEVVRRFLRDRRGEIRYCERCEMQYHVGAGVPEHRMRCPRCKEALSQARYLQLVEADGEVK